LSIVSRRPAKVHADAGLVPVQLRFKTGAYRRRLRYPRSVARGKAFVLPAASARGLWVCPPWHLRAKEPGGILTAPWYCRQGHRTFSLLPDYLAARFPGTLSEIERLVATVEQARSLETATDARRSDPVSLTSAVRWVRRRVGPVRRLLTVLVGLLPQFFLGCAPTIGALRRRVSCAQVLMSCSELAQVHLQALSRPLRFEHPSYTGGERNPRPQQHMGPDPLPRPA
jgi:hypothetical protein